MDNINGTSNIETSKVEKLNRVTPRKTSPISSTPAKLNYDAVYGTGVDASVGQALVAHGETLPEDAILALRKANSNPLGLERVRQQMIFGIETAGRLAEGLLPAGASQDDVDLLAGALTSENHI